LKFLVAVGRTYQLWVCGAACAQELAQRGQVGAGEYHTPTHTKNRASDSSPSNCVFTAIPLAKKSRN